MYAPLEIELYKRIIMSAECASLEITASMAIHCGVLMTHRRKPFGLWRAVDQRLCFEGLPDGDMRVAAADAEEALAACLAMVRARS